MVLRKMSTGVSPHPQARLTATLQLGELGASRASLGGKPGHGLCGLLGHGEDV